MRGCQRVIVWAEEGRSLASAPACLNFGYLVNALPFLWGWKDFLIAQEEQNILFCAC